MPNSSNWPTICHCSCGIKLSRLDKNNQCDKAWACGCTTVSYGSALQCGVMLGLLSSQAASWLLWHSRPEHFALCNPQLC